MEPRAVRENIKLDPPQRDKEWQCFLEVPIIGAKKNVMVVLKK
jgi:hypothetical protein